MILLVEDDEDVRDLLQLTLEAHGCKVTPVSNGAAALEAMTRHRPCLVLLDLVMPVMNGWSVLAEIRTRGLGDIPVCVMTALGVEAPPEAVAALSKPFDTAALLALADRYCAHR